MISRLKMRLSENWSLILCLGIFWITCLILYLLIIKLNQGNFNYVLDDAYIHMAMAKNFAQYGVWGVTRYGFSSSTSSILWVLILSSIYKIASVNEYTPFILNIIFASCTISLTYLIFYKNKFPQCFSFIILLFIIFVIPIPALVFIGMEHSLQLFLVLAFVIISSFILSKNEIKEEIYLTLYVLGIILTLLRYESLIIIWIVAILMIFKKKYRSAVYLTVFSMLPIILYGLISLNNGWLFIPNSIYIKSIFASVNIFSIKGFLQFFYIVIHNLEINILPFLLILICIIFYIPNFDKSNIWDFNFNLLVIFILITFSNLSITVSNLTEHFLWFFRYDAFIILLGMVILSLNLKKYLLDRPLNFKKEYILRYMVIFLLILLIISLSIPRACIIEKLPQATNNIYEQQYQMGLFINNYYNGESVAINDLGAISYLSQPKILDLWGLGSMDIINESLQIYDTDVLKSLINKNQVKILVIYDQKFDKLPKNLIKVAEWTTPHNIICSYDTISFYATNSEEAQKLNKNLREFAPKLPSDIVQKYYLS